MKIWIRGIIPTRRLAEGSADMLRYVNMTIRTSCPLNSARDHHSAKSKKYDACRHSNK